MADTPRRKAPKKKKSPATEAQIAKLRAEKGERGTHPAEMKLVSEMPRWVKMALAEYETQDITMKQAAERYGKSIKTLETYAYSAVGRAWREKVREVADDPEKLSMAMIRSSAMHVTLDYLAALQSAIEAGDYREIGVMSRDILDRLGMVKQTPKAASVAAKAQIVINLGPGATLDAPTVKSALELPAELIEDGDFEVVEDE